MKLRTARNNKLFLDGIKTLNRSLEIHLKGQTVRNFISYFYFRSKSLSFLKDVLQRIVGNVYLHQRKNVTDFTGSFFVLLKIRPIQFPIYSRIGLLTFHTFSASYKSHRGRTLQYTEYSTTIVHKRGKHN